jgi:hypothetical protein
MLSDIVVPFEWTARHSQVLGAFTLRSDVVSSSYASDGCDASTSKSPSLNMSDVIDAALHNQKATLPAWRQGLDN